MKQFVRGGRAISEAGKGKSITDGLIQYLDSEEVTQVTDTPGYEETSMLSPDETLAVVMSPRFSTPLNMFTGGKTVYEGKMTVHGEHNGEMELRAVFDRPTPASPSMLIFDTGEDGAPQSRGYATYDGQTLRIEDMEP